MSAVEFTAEQFVHPTPVAPRVQAIAVAVADKYGISVQEMIGPRREAALVAARLDLYKELRAIGWSYSAIGRFVDRDHTTVLQALRGGKSPELRLRAKLKACGVKP